MTSESNSHDDGGAGEAPPLLSPTRRSFLKGLTAGAAGAGLGSVAEQRLSRQDEPGRPVLTAVQAHAHADAAVAMLDSLLPELVDAFGSSSPIEVIDARVTDALAAVHRKQQAVIDSLRQLDPAVSARLAARCDRIARGDDSAVHRLLSSNAPQVSGLREGHLTTVIDATRSFFAEAAESLVQQSALATSRLR